MLQVLLQAQESLQRFVLAEASGAGGGVAQNEWLSDEVSDTLEGEKESGPPGPPSGAPVQLDVSPPHSIAEEEVTMREQGDSRLLNQGYAGERVEPRRYRACRSVLTPECRILAGGARLRFASSFLPCS